MRWLLETRFASTVPCCQNGTAFLALQRGERVGGARCLHAGYSACPLGGLLVRSVCEMKPLPEPHTLSSRAGCERGGVDGAPRRVCARVERGHVQPRVPGQARLPLRHQARTSLL